MRWNELSEENCSMARTGTGHWRPLDATVFLRDCFLRVRRFEDFQERLGITRPILASRLKKLVDEFVLVKVPYQQRPTRYEYRLTPKGLDLYPIVMSIVHWGDVHMAGKKGRPLLGLSTTPRSAGSSDSFYGSIPVGLRLLFAQKLVLRHFQLSEEPLQLDRCIGRLQTFDDLRSTPFRATMPKSCATCCSAGRGTS